MKGEWPSGPEGGPSSLVRRMRSLRARAEADMCGEEDERWGSEAGGACKSWELCCSGSSLTVLLGGTLSQ